MNISNYEVKIYRDGKELTYARIKRVQVGEYDPSSKLPRMFIVEIDVSAHA